MWGLKLNVPRLEGVVFMNLVRWKSIKESREKLPNIDVRHRYASKQRKRKEHRLEKSHVNDAYCRGEFHPAKRQNGVFREKEAEEAHP